MARLEVKRQMGRGDIEAVSELLDVATTVDGHRPLGEHQWLDLVHGGREGFAGLVAWEPGHGHPVGYAQLSRGAGHRDGKRSWALELVVDPHHRDAMSGIAEHLLGAALDIVRTEGGGRVQYWVPKPGAQHDSIAAAVGLRPSRELRQLRRPLPFVDDSGPFPTRPFRPGVDEAAWLEVNNRAFASHAEQGGWDLETLKSREEQPWFDPEGFLLHERDGRLAGFCWTKIHEDHHPPLGEIYVIGVDPSFQGLGIGRSLTVAGMRHLAARGLGTAMLYVDASNGPALKLYESLGFHVDHVDRAYVADLGAKGQTPPTPTSDPSP